MAGYFKENETDSSPTLKETNTFDDDEFISTLFGIFPKAAQEKLDETRYGHPVTYAQTLHNGVCQVNAQLRDDQTFMMPAIPTPARRSGGP